MLIRFPSFVGDKIKDMFFFKNRLGFLTETNIIFSEADNYFNFFRTTTQQLLDSAPIDVGISHTKVAVLKYAVPFQEKLMLFSEKTQFVLRGSDLLTPKTVTISPVTDYDIESEVRPLAQGNYIYFSFPRDGFEGMYEYFVDNNTETYNATEITAQVPKYLPSKLRQIEGTASEDIIAISSDDTTDSDNLKKLYIYKYYWQNREKIQSAWMRFDFANEIVGFGFIASNLYLITKDGNLEKLNMENGQTDTGLTYKLLLDSRLDGAETTLYTT